MRYERKYRLEGVSVPAIRQLLRLHPAAFRTHFPDRQVNNVYFDTPALTTFHQNAAGDDDRKKFRVRWYGTDLRATGEPRLEIKFKQSELGAKHIWSLPAFDLNDLGGLSSQVHQLLQHQSAGLLQPTLLNSYGRSYLISGDGRYRLTIDYDLRYHSLLKSPRFHHYHIADTAVVLEIKYEAEDDTRIGHITQHLPFRQSRHSKYVNGMVLTR